MQFLRSCNSLDVFCAYNGVGAKYCGEVLTKTNIKAKRRIVKRKGNQDAKEKKPVKEKTNIMVSSDYPPFGKFVKFKEGQKRH